MLYGKYLTEIDSVYFPDVLRVERVKKKIEIWKLTNFFTCIVAGKDGEENYHIIPEGFESDGASVPRIFWSIYPPWGVYAEAAVVHDFHYRAQVRGLTRAMADKIFLFGMKELGVSFKNRYIIYYAVRLFGWKFWSKIKKQNNSK